LEESPRESNVSGVGFVEEEDREERDEYRHEHEE